MKIGKITDGWGLEYCVPLEVYVQRHINKIVYLQTADYLRKLYIEQLEKDIAYLTKEINDKLPAKLREVKNKKALLEQRKAYLKSNVDLQIEQIQKLLQQIKDSNKLSFYDTKMYTWNIDTRVVEEQRQAVRAQFWYRNIILEKYQEKKKAEDEEYQRKLRILTNEIKQKMIIIKQDIKDKIAGKEVRKNAEKVANHVAIFSKDDDRLNKVKARHNLFKLYLSLILEKTKEEISKLKQLHGPTGHDTIPPKTAG